MILLTLAAAVIAVNWGLYIWAVNSGQVVETALGYYINPILTVLLGVIFLRERLAAAQWVAMGFAVAAVLILTVDYGRPPWIALILAVSFGSYGLLKNRINAGAVATLTVESALLTPLALGYLIFLQAAGAMTFVHLGWGHSLLLVSAGLVTVLPLLLFSAAAVRIPLSTLGLLAVLDPYRPVPARGLLLRRGDAAGPLGRLRPDLGGPADPEWLRPFPGHGHPADPGFERTGLIILPRW